MSGAVSEPTDRLQHKVWCIWLLRDMQTADIHF